MGGKKGKAVSHCPGSDVHMCMFFLLCVACDSLPILKLPSYLRIRWIRHWLTDPPASSHLPQRVPCLGLRRNTGACVGVCVWLHGCTAVYPCLYICTIYVSLSAGKGKWKVCVEPSCQSLPCFTARPLCTVIRAVDSDVMTWGETTAGKWEKGRGGVGGGGGREGSASDQGERLHGWKREKLKNDLDEGSRGAEMLGGDTGPRSQPPRRRVSARRRKAPHAVTDGNALCHSGGCQWWDTGDFMGRSSGDPSAQTLSPAVPHLRFPPLSFTFSMFHSHMFLIGPKRRGRKPWKMGKGRCSGLFGFKSARP